MWKGVDACRVFGGPIFGKKRVYKADGLPPNAKMRITETLLAVRQESLKIIQSAKKDGKRACLAQPGGGILLHAQKISPGAAGVGLV